MKTSHLLLILGAVITAVAVLALVLLKITDPYRAYDFDRKPDPVVSVEPYVIPEPYATHPITGEPMTKAEYERERKTLEALLCSMGDEVYCG